MRSWILALIGLFVTSAASVQNGIDFDQPDQETDRLVAECLETKGVNMLEGSDVICYN